MNKAVLPQASDWNKFWEISQTKNVDRVSWSKKRILNVIQPFVVREKYALDAGCGSGFFSKHFCDSGMDTTSLDYSTQALAITKETTQGRCDVIQADVLSPDISSQITKRFDLIFTDGLLEHFDSDDQNLILLNFKKLLNEGGVIITFVPNRYSPWELIRPIFMPGIKEEPFTSKQLVELNERNGLSLLNQGGINTVPLALSPDGLLGESFGMLLYTISKFNGTTNG